jgi:hypothetical protein
MKYGLAICVTALLIGLTGCSAPQDANEVSETTESTQNENPYGGFPVDPPAVDEVVLTINGANVRDYTMGELMNDASVEVTITEPFVQRVETFQGVPLAALFEASGLTPGTDVTTIALNDYRYTDSVDAFTQSQGILAVSRNGQPIPMDEGGPIRIIFPEGTAYYTFLDAWNWSLRTIEPAIGSE